MAYDRIVQALGELAEKADDMEYQIQLLQDTPEMYYSSGFTRRKLQGALTQLEKSHIFLSDVTEMYKKELIAKREAKKGE